MCTFGFQEEGFCTDNFKDPASACLVFLKRFGEYQNVIHVDNHPSLVNLFLECLVHICLECHGGVAQSEEHDFWFEESEGRGEGRFPMVIWVNQDVVVSGADIHFGEVLRVAQLRNQGGNQGEGICILDCPFVDVMIILAGAKGAVFLSYKEESTAWGDFNGWMKSFATCSSINAFTASVSFGDSR